MGTGVIVLDGAQSVKVWNGQAESMWGLRATEAEGEHLMNLEIGLPVEKLTGLLRSALSGDSDGERVLEVEAVNRVGKPVTCRVTVIPLAAADGRTGAVLLMENSA
ncbi:MAG: PAS domain-containing protein [Thermoleophilaceae bacterium]